MTHPYTDLREAAEEAQSYDTKTVALVSMPWHLTKLAAVATPARILSLLEENQRLRDALNDAIDCVEAWGGYASDYFKDKHDFQGDLDRLRAALKEKPHD